MCTQSEIIKNIILSKDLNITDIANYTGISLSKIHDVLDGQKSFNKEELYLLELRIVKQNCSCIHTNTYVKNKI